MLSVGADCRGLIICVDLSGRWVGTSADMSALDNWDANIPAVQDEDNFEDWYEGISQENVEYWYAPEALMTATAVPRAAAAAR